MMSKSPLATRIGLALALVGLAAAVPAGGDALPLPLPVDETRPGQDPQPPFHPHDGLAALPAMIADIDEIARGRVPADVLPHLTRARASLALALRDLSVAYDADVQARVAAGAAAAAEALEIAISRDEPDPRIEPILVKDAAVVRSAATRIIGVATSAGVERGLVENAWAKIAEGDSLVAAAQYVGAIGAYAETFTLGDAMHFDMDRFELEILAFIGGEVVGYAYSLGKDGLFDRSGHGGDARTDGDAPQMEHGPTQEQHLASVSKPITAVSALHLLQEEGISVDESIVDYLPPDWNPHSSIDQLTFRDLLTHKSGFASSQPSAYAGLRATIEGGVPQNPATSTYANANFGMFRVLIPHIWPEGQDLIELFQGIAPDLLTALIFEYYVRTEIFEPMDIDGSCSPQAPDTRYYNWPDDGQTPGWQEPSNLLGCGGYGWHLSTNELLAFLAFVRYADSILTPLTRQTMDFGFLGWSPSPYSNGAFGTYRGHGGDWYKPAGQSHTCVMNFPEGVQASLVMNSERGFYTGSGTGQCDQLSDAYDDAWVAD